MLIWLCLRISLTTRGAPCRSEERDRAVPRIVESDHSEVGGLGDAGEGPVDVPGLDRAAGAGSEDVAGLLPPLPRLGPGSGLSHPVPAQWRDFEFSSAP